MLSAKKYISIAITLSSISVLSGCATTVNQSTLDNHSSSLTTMSQPDTDRLVEDIKTPESTNTVSSTRLTTAVSPTPTFDENRAKNVDEQQIVATVKKFYYAVMQPDDEVFNVVGGALLQQTFTNKDKPLPDNIVREVYKTAERENFFDIVNVSGLTRSEAAEIILVFGITAVNENILQGGDRQKYDFDIDIDTDKIEVYGNTAVVPESAIKISNFTIDGKESDTDTYFDYLSGDIKMKYIDDMWKIEDIKQE